MSFFNDAFSDFKFYCELWNNEDCPTLIVNQQHKDWKEIFSEFHSSQAPGEFGPNKLKHPIFTVHKFSKPWGSYFPTHIYQIKVLPTNNKYPFWGTETVITVFHQTNEYIPKLIFLNNQKPDSLSLWTPASLLNQTQVLDYWKFQTHENKGIWTIDYLKYPLVYTKTSHKEN